MLYAIWMWVSSVTVGDPDAASSSDIIIDVIV
jgi:hypothetical protein